VANTSVPTIAVEAIEAPAATTRPRLRVDVDAGRVGATAARLAAFTLVAIVMAFPAIEGLGTMVPGNPGDAYFSYWVLMWDKESLGNLFSGYWTGPIFAGNPDTMAWSETYLALAIPFWFFSTITRSPVAAMNLVYLLAWALSAEWTYRLVHRVTSSGPAAFVGALAFTYSTIRLTQTGHYQLTFGALLPLCVLLALKLFDRPSAWRGVALGASLAALLLSVAYYAVLGFVAIGTAAVAYLVWRRGRTPWRQLLIGGGAAVATFAVLAGPVAYHYAKQQEDSAYRRAYPAEYALQLGDLRTVPPQSLHLGDVDLLRSDSAERSTENYAFPGFVTLVFVPIGLAVALVRRWWRRLHARDTGRVDLLVIGIAGLLAFLIAIGRNPVLGVEWPVYDLARNVLPGVRSMLALVRLFVLTQLALVVVACVGIAFALTWIRREWLRWTIAVAIGLVVLLETAQSIPMTRMPTAERDGAANVLLADLPAGRTVEVPMAPPSTGAVFPYTENPRMMLATIDWNPRLNGYSGFVPTDYQALTESTNRLPDPASLAELQRRDVRYVVLHTAPLDTGLRETSTLVNGSGYAYMAPAAAEAIVAGLPPDAVRQVLRTDGAVIVELCPSSGCGEDSGGA
jgi:hypothetical protein